jgi:uncharacterized RDD family membrane protein YckC
MSEGRDPYETPKAENLEAPVDVVAAHIGRRFFNFLIDYVVLNVLVFIVTIAVVIMGGQAAMDVVEANAFAIGVVSLSGYYLVLEASFDRTIGKLVTGTRVVNEQGERPSFPQIAGRTLCRFIPFEMLSIFFGTDLRCWHDSLPKTYVIRS